MKRFCSKHLVSRVTQVVCVIAALSACSRSPSQENPSPPDAPSAGAGITAQVASPLIGTKNGWQLPAMDPQAGWHPTRKGVSVVAREPGTGAIAFDVSYTRDKGTASGTAFMLPKGSTGSLKSLVINASATPDQRLHICLTDTNGIVWTLPTVRLTATAETFELRAAEIGPDPFQNAGKSPPATPDWSTMQMITILDISGHMGAPSVPCQWRIESVEGVVR
jgi:hypothetical protein